MYGVVDIGSNSIRLVIYEVDGNQIRSILNKKYSAGLASYVLENGDLSEEGIQVAAKDLNNIQRILSRVQIEKLYIYATASLRNISNSADVVNQLKEMTGMSIRILSGQEEAFFDYYATLQANLLSDTMICDIGGGSTEVVLMKNQKVVVSDSLPVGSLNMYSLFVSNLIPTDKELEKIHKNVLQKLAGLYIPEKKIDVDTIIGIGGTCRGSLKLYKHLFGKPKDTSFDAKYLSKILKLQDKNPAKVREAILKNCPERIHTILPGIEVLNTVCEYYKIKKVVISTYGCREGFLYYNLKQEGVISER